MSGSRELSDLPVYEDNGMLFRKQCMCLMHLTDHTFDQQIEAGIKLKSASA